MNEQVPSKEYLPRVDRLTVARVIDGSGTQSERSAVWNYICGLERTLAERTTPEPPAVQLPASLLDDLLFEHKDSSKFENARQRAAEIVRSSPTPPPSPSHPDTDRLDWLEQARLRAVPFSERSRLDEGMEYLWWQIVDGKKSVSGHPLATLREAIDAARHALTKLPE
jgi:hypothetical protein